MATVERTVTSGGEMETPIVEAEAVADVEPAGNLQEMLHGDWAGLGALRCAPRSPVLRVRRRRRSSRD